MSSDAESAFTSGKAAKLSIRTKHKKIELGKAEVIQNGTDITIKISPRSNATILDEQPLTLYTYPIEENTKGFLNDSSYLPNEGVEEITLTGDDGYLQTEVYQKGQQINSDSYTLMWNLAGNPSESANLKSNFFDLELDNNNLTNIVK